MERYRFTEAETAVLEANPAPFGIFQMLDNRVVTVLLSDGFRELLGTETKQDAYDFMERDMYINTHPDDVERLKEAIGRFVSGEEDFNVIYRLKLRGEYRVIHSFARHIYRDDVKLAEVWYIDEGNYIGSEEVQLDSLARSFSSSLYEYSLHRETNYDPLTGIPNLSYFIRLAREFRDRVHKMGGHCAIGFANINGLKYYNQKFGFAEGDRLLREFASLLTSFFGSESCCRMGTDNFAFFCITSSIEENINQIVAELNQADPEKQIHVRVGIYPDTMGVVDTALACDRARFACNQGRRSRTSSLTYFDETMLNYEKNRQYVLENLDRAIAEDWIQPFYQPIIRAANGKVCDEEALARWIDPEKGVMSPAEFIPILEDAKLIYKVDLHMVDKALEKIRKQIEGGYVVMPVSINLSRTDFETCDIVEEIRSRVDACGVDRSLITIEITESVIGGNFEFMKEQVERFRSLGFAVWMDDFGSGYSSLDVLQSIRFDLIKLDMRFMRQFHDNERSRIILTELMKMAMGLGLETICEGVEDKEQVDFLRESGCTKLQGFYYSKPVSFTELVELSIKGSSLEFEDPVEMEYYATIGRVNLYDMSVFAEDDAEDTRSTDDLDQYFNTLPMAVLEVTEDYLRVLRCNQTYRKFLESNFGTFEVGEKILGTDYENKPGYYFFERLIVCANGGGRQFIDEPLDDRTKVRTFVRKLSVNPVTGIPCCVVVVLGVFKENEKTVNYADVANSLSSDYMNLFYVDLETEEFAEYKPDPKNENLTVERKGTDFFANCKVDAPVNLFEEDVDRFNEAFTRENVLRSIEETGSFSISYRILNNGDAVYVNMKALRMTNDNRHLIIGISNVDEQMRKQEQMERMEEDRITYKRICALSGNFFCIYTVDPETESFYQYGANWEYDKLQRPKKGENFFRVAKELGDRFVYEEDRQHFEETFSRERIMSDIEKNGVYILFYRLLLKGKPVYVTLRAAMVEEKDGPKLIVGLCNIDAQVRSGEKFEGFPF